MRAALERGGVPGADVQRLTAGVVCSAGAGQGVARQIALEAGRGIFDGSVNMSSTDLSPNAITSAVNKVCASGMLAVEECAMRIQLGLANVCVAVGAESMSNVPFYLPRKELPFGGVPIVVGLNLSR